MWCGVPAMPCGAIAMQILYYYKFQFFNFQFSIFNLSFLFSLYYFLVIGNQTFETLPMFYTKIPPAHLLPPIRT